MPSLLSNYSAVVFDVGGTLLRLNLDALAQAYLDQAKLLDIVLDFQRTRQVIAQLELELPLRQQSRAVSLEHDNGREFWINFYTEGFRRLGVTQNVFSAADEIRARFQRAEFETLYDDVLPALEALATRGLCLGILSNYSKNLESVLIQVGIHHFFRFFIVSAVAGLEKPDPRIFDLTVQTANYSRQQIVYIGDSVFHDIEGARRAGMDAILIDRLKRYPNFDGRRIDNLKELF
ncbi:MAG: HAD-IA family hydrolase [Chloroflexi bacterium]|nr:HAD-IA family hydrolase [Chloroflexota bacterium]